MGCRCLVRGAFVAVGLLVWSLAPTNAQAQCEAPQAMLVVDKSSSMTHALPSGISKWDAARMALSEVANEFADSIDIGLQVFPYPNQCAPGPVTVDIGSNDADTILDALGGAPPMGGNWTPMAQTLEVTAAYAPLLDSSRANHVVLITDGWQWCDPYDPATRSTPVTAVEALHDVGVTVHVVGFGAAVDALTLNRSAVAGGTARPGCDPDNDDPADPNHCYHQANDLSELSIALSAIAQDITDEVCDGFDNDCDEMVDEGFDRDDDGYSICGTVWTSPGVVDPARVDCNDNDPDVHPGARELCDGVDNDCDGATDPDCGCSEGATQPCGTDVGVCSPGTQTCFGGRWGGCEGAVAPAATELCDGADDDCDERVDEGSDCGPNRACMNGRCVDLAPPTSGTETPPREDMDPPAQVMEAGWDDGGCCSIGGVGRPARSLRGGALGLGALLMGVLLWRRRRR